MAESLRDLVVSLSLNTDNFTRNIKSVTKQIQEEFGRRCGAIKCRDLKAITDGKPLCPCEECVRNAVLIYGEKLGL